MYHYNEGRKQHGGVTGLLEGGGGTSKESLFVVAELFVLLAVRACTPILRTGTWISLFVGESFVSKTTTFVRLSTSQIVVH